ncbi:glycosyltransferase family 2 protein [Mycobacterium kansasii]|uniref:glycosyltransferase family 2 protein n=1 Tax=Mycobacterium kansasii TaxID=1768 RepID=UPI0015E23466|nr:glycosyltransferase [Mycobacterium kansasii]
MTPLVSVVVPVYNCVDFIDATMQSILAQTFSDLELVVSDNASTDGTWEALQRHVADPRVRLTRHASTIPAAENFNHVTELATGEFVKLVCADDVLYPDNLEVLVSELTAHPSALLAVSSRDLIDATGRILVRNRGLAGLRGEVAGTDAIRRSVLAGTNIFGEPPSALFRRAALIDAGGWDRRFPYLMDLVTYCAVLLHGNGNLIAVPRPLWAFRISGGQETVRTYMHLQTEQVIGFYRELAAEHPGLLSRRHLVVGSMRARMNAIKRRAVYRWLGRGTRLGAPAAGSQRDASNVS